jgi:predicted porin
MYAAWKGQIAYTSPNWNGFQFTAAVTNPNGASVNEANQDRLGMEGKASYTFTGDVSGKVWASAASYDVQTETAGQSYKANAWDIGTTINVAGFGLTGYYYDGKGVGTTALGLNGYNAAADKRRESDGGYVQATYVIPTGTKLGVAYGISNLDKASGEADLNLVKSNRRYTVGAYHPLTKSLNLVAEYNDVESEAHLSTVKDVKSKTVSLGAILFF